MRFRFSKFVVILTLVVLATSFAWQHATIAAENKTTKAAPTLVQFAIVSGNARAVAGDRIDLAVLCANDTTKLRIELRAVAAPIDKPEQVSLVLSKNEKLRNAKREYILTKEIASTAANKIAAESIDVAYTDFDLPAGKYLLAYELRGLNGNEVEFVRASELRETVVSNVKNREVNILADAREAKPRVVDANILKGERLTKKSTTIQSGSPRNARPPSQLELEKAWDDWRKKIDEKPEEAPQYRGVELNKFVPSERRQILFATNRGIPAVKTDAAKSKNQRLLRDKSAELSYGVSVVNIPVSTHRRGKIELKTLDWWQVQKSNNAFSVEPFSLLKPDDFQKRVSSQDILLFVHGFANTFDDTMLRTAQLHHDLEFPGTALTFSWPSEGIPEGMPPEDQSLKAAYGRAEITLQDSVADLAKVLGQIQSSILQTNPEARIHIIAHSLGCRLLLQAISHAKETGQIDPQKSTFGNIVLAAPDVDPQLGAKHLPTVVQLSKRMTYYYSSLDMALNVSLNLHGSSPMGLAPLFSEKVDTINADRVNNSFGFGYGHSYFAESLPLLDDVKMTVVYGLAPHERQPPLEKAESVENFSHWTFLPTR